MSSKRDEYVRKFKTQLDEWNEQLERLEERAGELRLGAASAYRQRIARLRTRRDELESKLKDLISASGTAWDAVKSALEVARDEFRRSFEEAKREGETEGKEEKE